MPSPLLELSATQLSARIRARQISSREVVEAHLEHARVVNERLRAIVVPLYQRAREAADACDRRLAASDSDSDSAELPPFFGVPCTVKESFAVAGQPNTAGLVSRRELRAEEDAETVRRLVQAGAIVLGLTNTSELCMWFESGNRVYGRTGNAYDAGRIAGGSSGGEGSAVGAGLSPFGLGADIGGSIRMPAFFNGVFGHKPSPGLVPNEGQFPIAHGDALRLLSTGPLCRRAEDLWPILRLLAFGSGAGGEVDRQNLPDPAGLSLRGLPVALVTGDGLPPVSPELAGAMGRAALALEHAGLRVREVSIRGLEQALSLWAARLHAAGGASFAELLGGGVADRSLSQWWRFALGRSPHTLPALALAFLEAAPAFSEARLARVLEEGRELRARVVETIGEGVLLYPPFPSTAPRHGLPLLFPLGFRYTALWNALELPVTQVPLGLSESGLPLGVQVVAGPSRDSLGIAVALELERSFGGWVPPWRA